MLFSDVYYTDPTRNLSKGLATRMGLCPHYSIYELVHQYIFVLLASSRDSDGSCKETEENYTVYIHLLKQGALYFLRFIKGLTVVYLGYPQNHLPLGTFNCIYRFVENWMLTE